MRRFLLAAFTLLVAAGARPGRLDGSAAECTQWHRVQAGDTCYDILAAYHDAYDLEAFYRANPEVNEHCTNLETGADVCVSGKAVDQGDQGAGGSRPDHDTWFGGYHHRGIDSHDGHGHGAHGGHGAHEHSQHEAPHEGGGHGHGGGHDDPPHGGVGSHNGQGHPGSHGSHDAQEHGQHDGPHDGPHDGHGHDDPPHGDGHHPQPSRTRSHDAGGGHAPTSRPHGHGSKSHTPTSTSRPHGGGGPSTKSRGPAHPVSSRMHPSHRVSSRSHSPSASSNAPSSASSLSASFSASAPSSASSSAPSQPPARCDITIPAEIFSPTEGSTFTAGSAIPVSVSVHSGTCDIAIRFLLEGVILQEASVSPTNADGAYQTSAFLNPGAWELRVAACVAGSVTVCGADTVVTFTVSPASCAAGTGIHDGASDCTPCAPGSVQDGTGTVCTACGTAEVPDATQTACDCDLTVPARIFVPTEFDLFATNAQTALYVSVRTPRCWVALSLTAGWTSTLNAADSIVATDANGEYQTSFTSSVPGRYTVAAWPCLIGGAVCDQSEAATVHITFE